MVYSSPVKRSALGSISSILNTTPKTPTRQGRVGKSATPRSNGIRQKLAHLFGVNKENNNTSPCKTVEEENWKVVENLEVPRRGQQIYHLLVSEKEVITTREDSVRQKPTVMDVDVSTTSTEATQQLSTTSAASKFSPEALYIATLLSNRLRLAAYKVSTQQIHTPFSELVILPAICTDTSVSQAIHRFQESKKLQDQARYFRKHRLSTICRRESRRTRRSQTQITTTTDTPTISTTKPQLIRQPSTIMEESSASDEEAGLPSPPDSQPPKTPLDEILSTPAPKRRIRKMRISRKYNENNGHLGLSSPPQQAYDPLDNGEGEGYYMEDVEVGDVPSSVLRGVEGLWALGFKA